MSRERLRAVSLSATSRSLASLPLERIVAQSYMRRCPVSSGIVPLFFLSRQSRNGPSRSKIDDAPAGNEPPIEEHYRTPKQYSADTVRTYNRPAAIAGVAKI